MVGAFKTLKEFCKHLGIQPFAENLDPDEFSPESLSFMSVNELQHNFNLSKEAAKRIYENLEQFRKPKKTKRRMSSIFTTLMKPSTPTKPISKPTQNRTFENEFEDLSDVMYQDGDDWPMDPCSAAYADSFNYFKETFDEEKYQEYANSHGWTPLMYACAMNCEEIVAFILSKSPNLCVQNDEKETALMIAASFGHVSIIKLFVEFAKKKTSENGKSVKEIVGLDLLDDGDFTALHYAVFYAQHKTVTYLLELGVDPNAPDSEGMTPTLMACVDEIQEKSLLELIEAGGNLNHCNRDGQNGYAIAKRESVDLLKMHKSGDGKSFQYGSF